MLSGFLDTSRVKSEEYWKMLEVGLELFGENQDNVRFLASGILTKLRA